MLVGVDWYVCEGRWGWGSGGIWVFFYVGEVCGLGVVCDLVCGNWIVGGWFFVVCDLMM